MKALLQPLITLGIILLCSMQVFAQGVVISEDENATADPSAILDVQSGDKGFLPPRMTTAEWNAIAVPANGLVVYDTDENKLFLFNGTEWVELSAAGSRWEADGDDIYRIDGNVGIGTSTPGSRLEIAGDLKLESGTSVSGFSTSTTLGNSNILIPAQNAVKTYVDIMISDAGTVTSVESENQMQVLTTSFSLQA